MSIVNPTYGESEAGGFKQFEDAVMMDGKISEQELLKGKYDKSPYDPTDDEKEIRNRIIKDYQIGVTNLWTPRVEFNDLAVIQRMQVDQMSFNTYQPNNGESASADDIQGWRSNAMRPVIRNKVISIAAHATARLIFPKIFAYNDQSDEQRDAAQVMEDLMEWAGDQSNYRFTALRRVISALTDPASIGYTEYGEVFRRVKDEKKGDKWSYKTLLDPAYSGFQDVTVSADELFIENFYEPDIQKQGFLVWRRVISYSQAKAKYGSMYENFDKYVRPGVQTIYSDANQSFYFVYDPNMSQYDVEEIIYWNKALDVKIVMVNGVLLTDYDNPNPRLDKQYPFDKFGYELINNRCFYYKSLAFKMMQDANIINTLYPMIVDGTYLALMPPMVNSGSEVISSDVVVPGVVTTLSSPDAKLTAIQIGDVQRGFQTLQTVEESISESSQSEIQQGQTPQKASTAYEISRIEQNAATVLGLFIQMIAQHVRDFGKLRLGDILQYLTIADVADIEGDAKLTFKAFLMPDKQSNGETKTRKIQFDMSLPNEPLSSEDQLDLSYDTLKKQGSKKTELYRVNPELFRDLTYMVTVSPDVLNPRSEDLERAFHLETYDRMILNPTADQEEAFRLLLATDPKTRRDPDKYVMKQQATPVQPGQPGQQPQNPLDAMMGKTPLPQTMGSPLA